MRYLITGGAGFIGSHLTDALLRQGDRVHALDDLSTGSIENIRHLRGHPRFEYTIDTAANARLIAELVDEADFVFHLAAAVGVELIVESPVRTIETNVHCTEVVLSQASKKRRPVLIASTSEVYGKSTALPFKESGDITLGPSSLGRWAYACSKAIDEFLAIAYWKERKLPTTVARLFNTVGSRQTGRYGMVVPRLTRQALSGQPLTVHGDGRQQRCFCHVTDIVEGLVGLIGIEEAHGEVYNLGSAEEVSIIELARRIIMSTGSESEISLIPYVDAYGEGFEDMARRVPDTTKIRELIGWEAKLSLDNIIQDMIESQQVAPVV
jgi:UDP-glucose 4-epimerase